MRAQGGCCGITVEDGDDCVWMVVCVEGCCVWVCDWKDVGMVGTR